MYGLEVATLRDGVEESRERVRAQIEAFIADELLGPSSEDEIILEPPTSRYLCGMLAPRGTFVDTSETDTLGAGGEDDEGGTAEAGVPLTDALFPSSIGLSFLVGKETRAVSVTTSWGEYRREEEGESDSDPVVEPNSEHQDDNAAAPPTRRSRVHWRRHPHSYQATLSIDKSSQRQRIFLRADGPVAVHWVTRPMQEAIAVSVFLVNEQRKLSSAGRDERWLFQPQMSVSGVGKDAEHPFLARSHTGAPPQPMLSDAELQSNELLYRKRLTFATGLGCAAEWSNFSEDDLRVGIVWAKVIPRTDVPRADPGIVEADLSMAALAEADATAIRPMLEPLLRSYADWIDQQRRTVDQLDVTLQVAAAAHLSECESALSRMAGGLALLESNAPALQAFQFANHVMLLQRSHSEWSTTYRKTGVRDGAQPVLRGAWYPFQMGFILMNVSGLVEPEHADRLIADLLWFPTGGGKTEAYLGLAAFTMGMRRLRSSDAQYRSDYGVTVLMRYTLRLLTVQQFLRAATLICACEVVRGSDEATWGTATFSVGLWVGGGTTPNSFEQSEKALTDVLRHPDQPVESGTPVQVLACPWCGESMTARNYFADTVRERTFLWCPRKGCEFSQLSRPQSGLPVLVVDEEIYRECPSLVVGTVDKFARMPWRGEVQSLFGRVERHCARHGFITQATDEPSRHSARGKQPAVTVTPTKPLHPPELIIQDELHLISGPLGTLVGLYESAIDWLSASPHQSGARLLPKVIASTATIRRATQQVQRVFTRQLRTFPPPGLDASDSFFSRDASLITDPGRRYMGIFAPGKSMKTAVARVYAAVLAATAQQATIDPQDADTYMTLVGYFNSLRELGGTVRLLEDDIPGWLRRIERRLGVQRHTLNMQELTSRRHSSEIPQVLDQLDVSFAGSHESAAPVDVLLATNMISVGVDVQRLGLMVVAGQPKTTAEYIQATSRIGRRTPGLVITIFNWARFRDLSHIERFRSYHEALYRHVEGVSVTPYSSRARDRALHAVLVSMTRLGIDGMSPEAAAASFNPTMHQMPALIDAIIDRARKVAGDDVAAEVAAELRARADEWKQAAAGQSLRYSWQSKFRPVDDPPLLRVAGTDGVGIWPTLNSLRGVEPEAGVRLLGHQR